jgi:3-oxoadipate enol-lactonase
LLHGWTATADLNWGRSYAALAGKFQVIAPDLRGHGRGIRGPFSLEACADDVAALLIALGAGPAILVGYSMGGPVATLVWRRHPALVAGMVLCSTAPHFATTTAERLALSALGRLAGPARRLPPEASRTLGALAELANGAGIRAGLPQAAIDMLGRHDLAAICEAAQALLAHHSDGWLGSVSVPSAVVMTTRDHLVPPPHQRRLAELIPRCSTFPVDGDHAVCAIGVERFLPVLLAALDDVARRTLAPPLIADTGTRSAA